MFANWFHFTRSDFFQAPAGEDVQEPVKVDFSDVNNPPSASTTPKAAAATGGKKKASKKADSDNDTS